MNTNIVVLAGRLTQAPEVQFTQKGTPVANIILANNEWRKDSATNEGYECPHFIKVTLWGKSAEALAKHAVKGQVIQVQGRLNVEKWEDKETGKDRESMIIVASRFEFGEKPKAKGEQSQNTQPVEQVEGITF